MRSAENFGHRTYNQYLQAMTTFCNWCASTRRLPTNPVLGIERLNTAVDVRHPRRALTAEEFAKMVQSARSSGVRIQGYSGEQRARIYLLSYLTGLRRNEISSLTSQSFSLKSDPPTLMVDAKSSKHRRKDVLPLHPELAEMLPEWLRGLNPGEKLFPKLGDRKTWRMVKMDLERAGIPYQTEEGIADFHAAGRHTHITELLRNGASLPEAKELARHSDIKTTMKYTHIGIADQARAVGNIPVPKRGPAVSPSPDAALHRRCISGDSDCLPVSQSDEDEEGGKRQNPRDCEGFGSVLDSMSQNVKVGATGFEPATFWSQIRLATSTQVV
ncbi:MAG: site-specific integrase [Planctomycetota bacterium]|nr:site-specific integrase [Planctomycetota bacterium]